MVEKKGQAAMEFLMTYGWALLVVLVAIGALAFFGVLNPGQFLPSSCTIAPGISCEDFTVTPNVVSVVLRNGMGEGLNTVSLTASVGSGTPVDCEGSVTIADGDPQTYTCEGSWGDSKAKLKADLGLTYKVGSSTISHTKTGQLVTQVE